MTTLLENGLPASYLMDAVKGPLVTKTRDEVKHLTPDTRHSALKQQKENETMKTMKLIILTCAGLLLAIVLPIGAMAQTETLPVLKAADLAPTELLTGFDFAVDDVVPTDGFYGIFTVRGMYGSVQARGVAMLRVRAAEMQALARLEETTRREAIVEGAKDSAQQTRHAAGQTIRDPAGTVERAPESVGKLFSRVGGKVEKRVEKVTGAGDGSAPSEHRDGIAKTRRSLAQKLGVDPYTDNPLLSAKLDQVARWERAGSLALAVGTSGGSIWAGIATKTLNVVWTMTPEEVRAANEKRLTSLAPGATADEIRAFLRNPAFTPTMQTLLVDQLEQFAVSRGCDSFVRLAGMMENYDQARFLVAATGLLATYHQRVAPLSSLESRGWLAVGLTSTGLLILPVPVDCLAWTDKFVEFRNRSDLHASRREILITGSATSRTRQELSARGWTLRERFQQADPGRGR